MKNFILCLGLILSSLISSAQGIQLFNEAGETVSGDTLVIRPKFCGSDFEQYEIKNLAKVVNKTNSTMTIGLKRYERFVIQGTGDAVCWGATCFGEKKSGTEPIWDVPDSSIVAADDTAAGLAGFVVYHFPNKFSGESTYLYEFYDRNDPSTKDSIFVKFVVRSDADSIFIENNKKSLLGDTLVVRKEVDRLDQFQSFEIKGLADIINYSCDVNTIGLRRKEHEVIVGTGDAVCWGATCFGEKRAGTEPIWDVGDSAIVDPLDAAGGLAGFVVYHFPNSLTGESLNEYEFYDRNNSNVASSVYVRFITTPMPDQIRFFKNNGLEVMSGDTLSFLVDVDSLSSTQEINLSSPVNIFNYSNSPINVGMSREEVAVVSGTEEIICWADSCSDKELAGTNQSINFPRTLSIAANDSAKAEDVFKVKFYPNNNLGSAIYKYDFFEVNNPSNVSSVFIKFDLEYVTSINENKLTSTNFSIFPNPAKDKLFISYRENAVLGDYEILIRDLLGSIVKRKNVSQLTNNVDINLTDLPAGIYLVSLSNNNSQVTKKLIIK